MSSSRALIRSLNQVFDYWDSEDTTLQTSELFKTITAFNEKHNTLQSIKQSTNIHGELYNFYNTHIRPASNLPREILFLDILTELSPVLSEEEVLLWLKTYLRPAVDSANFDVKFVSKCRNFIAKVTSNYNPTDDPDLQRRRESTAIICMRKILDLLLGLKKAVFEEFGIHIKEEKNLTQVDYERFRFIKRNATVLLHDFALEHPVFFANLTNDHLCKAKDRLEVLSLITAIVNSRSSKLRAIVHTELFKNLFRCLSFDFDERILSVCLSLLVMLVPLVSENVSEYLADIVAIYSRVVVWHEYKSKIPARIESAKKLFEESDASWEIASSNTTIEYDVDIFSYRFELDATHLATVIYGLFPWSFTQFGRSPMAFFSDNPPKQVEMKHILMLTSMASIEDSVTHVSLEALLKSKTNRYLKSFKVHPNFLEPEKWSSDYEIRYPTKWLVDENNEDSLGAEEIMIGCLNLNPDLAINFSETVKGMDLDRINSALSSFNQTGPNASSTSALSAVLMGDRNQFSPQRSRNTSVNGPLYLNFPGQMASNGSHMNFNRKLSIIPTHLIIDNNKASSEVTFKEVNYEKAQDANDDQFTATPINKEYTRSPLSRAVEQKTSDPIKELFLTHEKLYGPLNTATSNEFTEVNTSIEPKAEIHSLLSEKSTNFRSIPSVGAVETAVATKDNTNETMSNSTAPSETSTIVNKASVSTQQDGTVIDFFHRELLLLKNEVEFTSYMKHLSKFQSVKLRLQLNKLMQDAEKSLSGLDLANLKAKYQVLEGNYRQLQEADSELKEEFRKLKEESFREKAMLAEKCMELKGLQNKLQAEVEELRSAKNSLAKQYTDLSKNVIPSKDQKISELTADLQSAIEAKSVLQNKLDTGEVVMKGSDPDDSPEVSEYEKNVFKLKSEITMLSEVNEKLKKEKAQLQAQVDLSAKSFKEELGKAREAASNQIKSFNAQHERKVQELNATIAKYEGLIEEKNLRIAQAAASKPISIPGSVSINSDYIPSRPRPEYKSVSTNFAAVNAADMYEERGRSNSSIESTGGHMVQTQKLPAVQPIPIIKGRGGYQKRSKKLM